MAGREKRNSSWPIPSVPSLSAASGTLDVSDKLHSYRKIVTTNLRFDHPGKRETESNPSFAVGCTLGAFLALREKRQKPGYPLQQKTMRFFVPLLSLARLVKNKKILVTIQR
jgi:hypothetical protein